MDFKKIKKKELEEKHKAAMTSPKGPGKDIEKNKAYEKAYKSSKILDYSMDTSSPSEYLQKYKDSSLGEALRKKKRRGRR